MQRMIRTTYMRYLYHYESIVRQYNPSDVFSVTFFFLRFHRQKLVLQNIASQLSKCEPISVFSGAGLGITYNIV